MLEIRNNTAFSPMLIPGLDKHGNNYAVVIIKGSFNIKPQQSVLTISEEQFPAQQADEYFGEPGESSVKYEADNALVKQSTDIALNGHAYAPDGKSVVRLDTSLQIGNHQQIIRVTGDRFWQKQGRSWNITPPEKFERLALLYENAYGGAVRQHDGQSAKDYCSYNPLGKGYAGLKGRGLVEGLPLPNMENLAEQIQSWEDQPQPVGYGFISRNWEPRISFAGGYDAEWQQKRMPLLPLNFDDRYYNAAHPKLTLPGILSSGELVKLKNLSESGDMSFNLPLCQLSVAALIKGKTTVYQPVLDTILIEPDDLRVLLTWRIAIPCARQFLYIKSVTVTGGVG